MNGTDLVRLRHMLDAAREALSLLEAHAGRFEARPDACAIVGEGTEIIGEAASKISDELTALAPDIPWVVIAGMRNRLIHAYFEIKFGVVWTTATSKTT